MRLETRRCSPVSCRLPRVLLLAVVHGLAVSCHSLPSSPTSGPTDPTTRPSPASHLTVFTDAATGFSTSDLRDAQEQILQLSTAGELIWTADGTRLPGFRTYVDAGQSPPASLIEGNMCPEWCAFEIRFGTRDGERRAYLTVDYGHWNPGTLVDVEVVGGAVVLTETGIYPPGTLTLSGVVTEEVSGRRTPVEGAGVSRLVGGGWRAAKSDENGFYQIPGLYDGTAMVVARKEGYEAVDVAVTIKGDTRYDVELVRR